MVKALWEEKGSKKVIEILKKFKDGEIEIVMPSIAYYEIANAIRFNKELRKEEKKGAIKNFYLLEIEKMDLTLEEMKECIEIADERNTTIYDTSYYILSKRLNTIYITA
ncbi:MAG: type II toxin-antitoxin system VapC family toxin, partial [Thermoplasmata archaeon]|nr:type II toxin-antitoxin system VapC family toxin [Thermoplasmata archaeon]